MRGRCENFYRFRVERLIENEDSQGAEDVEVSYFKEQKDLTAKFGIPKSTIYLIIRYGDSHGINKWKNFFICKCREPAFENIPVEYVG
tara:strand:- start:5434 stop:5697 length:264 start_codon:yes stop_codon:yes gene_type:complete